MGKKKYIVLVVAIMILGLSLTSGTYAWLTWTSTVGSGKYNGTSTCFLIDYSYTNDDGTMPISGTMFQSKTPKGGLYGKVTMALSTSCDVTNGTGTLELYVNDATSDVFFNGDKALKYAVYTSSTATNPVNSGVITAKGKKTLYSGFSLSKTSSSYYVYIWLDGTLADNEYIDITFDGYITASATQAE